MNSNPGVIDYVLKSPSTSTSNGNTFSVADGVPRTTWFCRTGIEYTGTSQLAVTPGGVSGNLLGIDAVREFNVLTDSYSAQKHRQVFRWTDQCSYAIRNECAPRIAIRISSEQRPGFSRGLRSGIRAALPQEPVRRLAWRPSQERQTVSIRQLRSRSRQALAT